MTVRRRLIVERLAERRVLAAITGAVFEDVNLSFHREVSEAAAPQRLVFIDANQNERLDAGEAVSVADAAGAFKFDNLADGTYLLRLFNGTSSQTQTTPLEASSGGAALAVDNGLQFQTTGSAAVVLNPRAIVIGDLALGTSEVITLGDQLTKMRALPDGRLLVVGDDLAGATSWVVDPSSGSVSQLDLDALAGSTPWANLAIDGSGRGLILEQSNEPFALRAVDASAFGGDVQVTTTSMIVPADTQVLTSDSGSRSVLAWSGVDGLQLSLWSNVTASLITSSTFDAAGATELLAFDDASGLLAVRTSDGGVRVHDVDGDFAPIHSLDGVTGPVAIDGDREILVTISPEDAMLQLFSLRDGGLIADLAVDVSAIGPVSAVTVSDLRTIGVLGASGIAEIALRKPAAHQVTISGGQDPDPVLFGVALNGANTAPAYGLLPELTTLEDVPLIAAAPGALQGSLDAEGDQYVVIQKTQAAHGLALLRINGAISYTPDPNFNGTDSVVVLLHDGRDASPEVGLNIVVTSVPDLPTGVSVLIDPVPENVSPGSVIGTIEVIDADGIQDFGIEILDPRFGIAGSDIIFLGGDIDFETEPGILLPVIVTDSETGAQVESIFALTITDRNDPIMGISPEKASVLENDEGGFVTLIGVDDGDDKQTHTLTVDDDRFHFVGHELRLKPGVALDFETEPSVVVNVTATENIRNGNSLTEPVTIQVGDVPEQPQSIQLSDDVVMEKVPGDVVGEVTVDGGPVGSRFTLSVDDPRFEIADGTLKLRDRQIVEYAGQSEIELNITASDSQRVFSSISRPFLIQVLENHTPYHNLDNPFDVDHSGDVTAGDALAIINYINLYGPGPIGSTGNILGYDVNADTMVTALDALLVINEMNRVEFGGGTVGSGEVGGEGEQLPPPDATVLPIPVSSNDTTSGDSKLGEDDVFGQWGRQDNKLSVVNDGPVQADAVDSVEVPEPKSKEAFADNVDETLRMLSDQSL